MKTLITLALLAATVLPAAARDSHQPQTETCRGMLWRSQGDLLVNIPPESMCRIAKSDQARVRSYLVPAATSAERRSQLHRAAKREAQTFARSQMERMMAGMDIVHREEFEAVKEMAARARDENEKLAARIAALEAKLNEPKP